MYEYRSSAITAAKPVPHVLLQRFIAFEDWIWIHIYTIPKAFRVRDDADGKMEMRIAWTRIAGIADVANDCALFDELPFVNTVSTGL